MERIYKIGTRGSSLALKQTEEVLRALRQFYPTVKTEIITIDTYGDNHKITPISEIEGTDFFTREIDEALLSGKIDFAVHSAKDLPDRLKEGLVIAVLTRSIDSYDVLVSKENLKLDKLPYGTKIATSSMRRKRQLKRYRDDFEIIDIRGNIEERLEKLNNSDLDALVIAAAGLIRLGLEDRITQRIAFDILKPHPLQGSLAVIVKQEAKESVDLLAVIDARERILT